MLTQPGGVFGALEAVLELVDRCVRSSRPGVFAALIASTVLAVCFVWVPWESYAGGGFPDRDNYVASIRVLVDSGARFIDFKDEEFLYLLLNEYLWTAILLFIGNYFDDPNNGLLLFSALAVAIVSFSIIQRAGFTYALVLLLSPLAIDLFISQSRSAFALAIFIAGTMVRTTAIRYVLFVASLFIHSFAAVLFGVYKVSDLMLERTTLDERTKLMGALILGLLLAVIWAFFAQDILSAIGDRRAFQIGPEASSLAIMLWWACLLLLMVLFGRPGYNPKASNHIMLAVVLQSMFVFSVLLGAPSLRFLALALPFSLIAIRSIGEPIIRLGAIGGTLTFNAIHSLYWLA